jgi:hypothetical protein
VAQVCGVGVTPLALPTLQLWPKRFGDLALTYLIKDNPEIEI